MDIVEENTGDISLDYDACLTELVDSGHLYYDDLGDEKYYMISDKGRATVAELYDVLDKSFLERCRASIAKYVSLKKKEITVSSFIEPDGAKRFRVNLEAFDKYGDLMRLSITVNSMAEAVEIKNNYDTRPDGVYKGILFSVTGKMDFLA
jgi:DNA-binding PadR family transcriptional regulator